MKSKSFAGIMKNFVLLGLAIGVFLFILTQSLIEIPIVIGTTSYEGMTASLLLLIGSLIVVIIIGFVVSLFTYSAGKE
ncbi:hypothetical protein [Bacillus sp. JJ722]|uniref:hypothetical protein n=1 Tax=Bacillus sp. JJ722 TaxID=3122973 RepID=UPI0030000195